MRERRSRCDAQGLKEEMVMEFQVRVVGSQGDGEAATVDLEISPAAGAAKRVFIVLDLSDSAGNAFQSLAKLAWLWQSLPPQWLVSFYALSSREVLYPRDESLHVRDLESCIRDLEASPEVESWRASHTLRGSFARYPLTGIYEAWQAERALHDDPSREALVFLLTDGELLDLGPIRLPTGMTVVGVLMPSGTGAVNRWSDVLPKSQTFSQGATELAAYVRQLISPARQACDVVPSFDFRMKDDSPASAKGRSSQRLLKWDFDRGPLVIKVPASVIGNSTAVIECRPKKGGTVRVTLDGLTVAMSADVATAAADIPSATIGSGRLVVMDDQPFVAQLVEHLRAQAASGKAIDEVYASRLRSLPGDQSPKGSGSSPHVSRDCDAAVVVVPAGHAPSEAGRGGVLVGGLYKEAKGQLFIQHADHAPDDPGFTAKQAFRVAYDVDSARWHVFRGSDRKTLAPRACESLPDLFIDAEGRVCEAFYTGPLTSKKSVGE